MANIRKETWRHDWQPQVMQADLGAPRMQLLCHNCRLKWDEAERGSPPVTGCLTTSTIRHLGAAQQRDYMKDEYRRLAAWERAF